MKSTKYYQKIDRKHSILHALLLYSSSLSNIGLSRGKTGIAFFFMHYFRQTGEILYEDVAGELLEEVTEELHKELPITFESGLSGTIVRYKINDRAKRLCPLAQIVL